MEHTYLRYECADSFGLAVSGASSKAPQSNSNFVFVQPHVVLSTAGSHCLGVNVKTGEPTLKISHREQLSGGVGTGRALNSDQIVCLDVSPANTTTTIKIATGWVDGAVRVFDVYPKEVQKAGMIQSLLETSNDDEDFVQREPLLLNGHGHSPVRSLSFDPHNVSRLASGGSDGAVIVWDIVAEAGLFRLLGHRGGVTDIVFFSNSVRDTSTGASLWDGLITSSLDGLVKVWDLQGQCCTQTIANHHGPVLGMTATATPDDRCRLVAGGNDGQARVWSVQPPRRVSVVENDENSMNENVDENNKQPNMDDVCFFMGRLIPPPNVATSAEKIQSIRQQGRFVGILHANSKHVDVYAIRSVQESQKKRQRRLRRRQEKLKKKDNANESDQKSKKKKRGLLDDPSDDDDENDEEDVKEEQELDPELLKASDEFEYLTTVRASHKLSGFSFVPQREKGEMVRVLCALTANSLEVHSIVREKERDQGVPVVTSQKALVMDMYGHPTGIRSVSLSSDDRLACTVSKGSTKIWNVRARSVTLSLAPSMGKKASPSYGLCSAFLPGNTHIAVGTREGHLLLIDVAAGDLVYCEENAHDGAIWSINVRPRASVDAPVALITGSADKSVKFWEIEAQDDDEEDTETEGTSPPMFVHTRTLQMADDVIAARYSHSLEASKLMVFVATLDSTIKVFFDDSLKLFLSLYGHKLPVLALDCSDDDTILASSGADKTVKIFGLDFGDTHRTMHGHQDSVTDLRFVRRTHNFFTASKDGTVRYWDADRFQQILILNGHFGEVNSLAISRTGAFVLSGGMDRQVRVWERTKDIVFLEEERERELEQMFDKVERDEGDTAAILRRKAGDEDEEDNDDSDDQPQSEEAVKRSVLSVSSGDRILEALERADQETKEISNFRKAHGSTQVRPPNPMLLNMEPAHYMLWVLKSVKSAELEQSLLILPSTHLERLLYYLIALLRNGRGIELCSKIAIFMIKAHQNQVIATKSLAVPLRELRRLIRWRLGQTRDMIGYDIAALTVIARVAHERKMAMTPIDAAPIDVWAGMGKGSDVAAALQSRSKSKKQ